MKIFEMLKIAIEMDVDPVFVMNARRRYLTKELWKIEEEISHSLTWEWTNEWAIALFLHSIENNLYCKEKIKKELAAIDRLIYEQRNTITDEMIERARSTPIETILDFTKGKIRCIDPNHDDKNPSAYYGRRTNRLICPVCSKTWDAIACYQYVWSTDFKTAVKSLS